MHDNVVSRRRFALGAMTLGLGMLGPRGVKAGELRITPGATIGRRARDVWVKGYTQAQLDDAQAKFDVKFPPDLVALYRERRPIDAYDWIGDERPIREMLEWPFEGLLFDIEHNVLWRPEWGEKPKDASDRRAVLRAVLDAAPKLIPIYSHRFIPQEPHEAGNPIFSVYQSDIIYYGSDLADYFEREFNGYTSKPYPSSFKQIRFWSDMAERRT